MPAGAVGSVAPRAHKTEECRAAQKAGRRPQYANAAYCALCARARRLSVNRKTRAPNKGPGIPLYLINSGLLYDVIGGKSERAPAAA